MDSPDILAAIEALAPTAKEGIGDFLKAVKTWTPETSQQVKVHRSSDTVMIANVGADSPPMFCQFRTFSDSVRFEYMVRGYLASIKASA